MSISSRLSQQIQLTDVGRELDRELVPEWRAKYLDYKVCKDIALNPIRLKANGASSAGQKEA
jgi:hypothetical protein